MTTARFYMVVMFTFMAVLAVGAIFFMSGMQSTSYMITDGVSSSLRYGDLPRFDRNLVGFIYTFVGLIGALLFLIIILIPDQATGQRQMVAPQPRRRGPGTVREAGGGTDAPAAGGGDGAPSATDLADALEAEAAPPEPPKPQTVDEAARVDTAKAVEGAPSMDLPSLDVVGEISGEEDVVYGRGPVTEDSVFEFVQEHPDSAVKFLYRKNLNNRPLNPAEEDIYQKWERRGMARAKVREFVLEIMDWASLPDDYPHTIWRELRDRIFELKAQNPQ